MANRDNPRGPGGERWRGDDRDGRTGSGRSGGERWGGREDRSFQGGAEGEREPWRRERYGALHDQDRTNYGSGYDREGGGYGRGDHRSAYREPDLNRRGSGVHEFGPPADYGYQPSSDDYDPDYLTWRDEQLRAHDRDYGEWRREQHRKYDDEYRNFRNERREHFGRSFHEWRSQRSNMTTGVSTGAIEPGRGDYGERMGQSFGAGQVQKPSGQLGSPNDMTPDPALQQAVNPGPHTDAHKASDGGSEFGRTPAQIQAASEGGDTRAAADREDDDR